MKLFNLLVKRFIIVALMKKIIRPLPLLIVYAAIVYFSVKMPSGNPSLFKNIDKIYHFIAYFTLGFTICFSIINKKLMYILLILSLCLGLLMEYIQGTLPYRDMSIADGVSNTLGLTTGAVVFHLFYKQIYSIFKCLRLNKIFLD